MAEILLGVLATHLALVATNGAFHNNFGSGSRRSVHIGWGHTFQATRFESLPQQESDFREETLHAFQGCNNHQPERCSSVSYILQGLEPEVCYTKISR